MSTRARRSAAVCQALAGAARRGSGDRLADLGGAVTVLEVGTVGANRTAVADRAQQVVELMHEGVLPAEYVARRPPVLHERMVAFGHDRGTEALRPFSGSCRGQVDAQLV